MGDAIKFPASRDGSEEITLRMRLNPNGDLAYEIPDIPTDSETLLEISRLLRVVADSLEEFSHGA